MSTTIPVHPEHSRRGPPARPERSRREPSARPELVEGRSLYQHLPLIAAAPGGIKKLRELILELAVRGKLVPQDPSDEPAAELLKRIEAEKARLVTKKKIRKAKLLPAVSLSEMPYELPRDWVWCRLGNISQINPRNDLPYELEVSFVPMAMIGTRFDGAHGQKRRLWHEVRQNFTHFAEGDIGVAKITPCFENSKACVFTNLRNGVGAGTTELHIARRLADTLVPRYVLAYLKSPRFLQEGEGKMTGTAGQKRLPKDFVASNPFPLPPLAEQRRIVAKVDELMALCDRLEAQQADAEAAHTTLVKTLLDTLTQSQTAADFTANWQRLSAHFDTLFTTESSIDALKQTLLQLAVMGKLVPQNPKDEPADQLLERCQARKIRLIVEKKLRKGRQLPALDEGDVPFPVPSGWLWTQLDEVVAITGGVTLGRKLAGRQVVSCPYLRVANVQRGYLVLDQIKDVAVPEEEVDKYRLQSGDLLITEGGDWDKVGRAAIWRDEIPDCLHQNHVFRARKLSNRLDERWAEMYLNSPMAQEYFQDSSKQTTNLASINMTQLRSCAFPLPSPAEQHRIVAKVDELMALCDQLKAQLVASRTIHERLADALAQGTAA